MRYTPHTPEDRLRMCKSIGIADADDLFLDISNSIAYKKTLDICGGWDEHKLKTHLKKISKLNKTKTSFLGAGVYDHFIPSAVDHIIRQSAFYTAYTPYQAEVSQGVLQALFEYQSMICELTGMEVSNATMYDGSTALAESCVMAHNITGHGKIVAAKNIHPNYLEVLKTYCGLGGLKLEILEYEKIMSNDYNLADDVAAFVVQSPDFYGRLLDTEKLHEKTMQSKTQLIACVLDMTCLALIKPPSCDIFVGDGQSLGLPLCFGGPSYGVLATSLKHVRKMPGRIVGETFDKNGKRGFALTLQAREQHIRREKAASNICTSQSLCAIASSAYLALLGADGLKQAALSSHKNAVYLRDNLIKIGFKPLDDEPFYNEFTMKADEKTYDKIYKAGIQPGYKIRGGMIFAVTEKHSKKDLDNLVEALT